MYCHTVVVLYPVQFRCSDLRIMLLSIVGLAWSIFTLALSFQEKLMLKTLKFRLNLPTPYVFILRFLKAAQSDTKVFIAFVKVILSVSICLICFVTKELVVIGLLLSLCLHCC